MNRNFTPTINTCGCHRCHWHRVWLARASEVVIAIREKMSKEVIDRRKAEMEMCHSIYIEGLQCFRDIYTRGIDCIH